MLRFARSLRCGGALVAICLAATTLQAQDDDTRSSSETVGQFTALRSEVSEVRAKMNATVSAGYEQGPTCACNAHAEPSCGCQASCGGGGCGCDAGCGCCDACGCEGDCCSLPGCSCGFYAAGEVAWLRPSWSTFPAATVNPNAANRTLLVFDYDYDPTLKLTIGYTGCNGLGLRASWWEFDNDSDLISVTPVTGTADGATLTAIAGETLTVQQSLELKVGDFEFTNCFQACGGQMVVGFGVRYARLDLSVRERLITTSTANPNISYDYTQTFEGLGPTVGLEFIRPLCFSGLSFYSNLRGSVVVGDTNYSDTRRNAAGAITFAGSQEGHEPLFSADVDIALQYCRAGWFVRGGWQAQYWDGIGRVPFGSTFERDRPSLSFDGFGLTVGAQY